MTNYGRYKLEAIAPFKKIEHVLEENNVARMYPEQSSEFRRGGIGLYATAQDYSAFAKFLLTGKSDTGEKLISNNMIGLMRANRLPLSALPLSISGQAFPGYGLEPARAGYDRSGSGRCANSPRRVWLVWRRTKLFLGRPATTNHGCDYDPIHGQQSSAA